MSFAAIASGLPGRIPDTVRNRYSNHLDPALNKAKFTEEEKTIIMQVVAQYGEPKRWALIAKHVPGRSVLQIKNYWHNTTKRNGGDVVPEVEMKKPERQNVSRSGKKAKQTEDQVDDDRDDLTNHY
jgi:Myb-like DNA-binding domain